MFGSKKIDAFARDIEVVKSEIGAFISKSADTFNRLDDMISREQGGDYSYQKLVSDFNRIGDPYIHNLYVRKCVDKIAEMIAGTGFDIKAEADGDPLPETTPEQRLFRTINADDSDYDFIYEIVRSLMRFGKAFVRMSAQMVGGLPVVLDVLPADKVKAETDNGILKAWKFKNHLIPTDQIIFIRFKHPESTYDGLAPNSSAVTEILLQFYAQAYNVNFFKKGAMGAGYWEPADGKPLSPTQETEAQMLVDRTFNRGVDGSGEAKVASFRRKLQYVKLSESARDMQYNQLIEMTKDAIYQIYDIPKVIFASADSTFTNLYEAKKMLWTQKLVPLMRMIQSAFDAWFARLNRTRFLRFRVDEIKELQDDVSTRLDSALKFQALGIPIDIINERLGLGLPEDIASRVQAPQAEELEVGDGQKKKIIAEHERARIIEHTKSIPHDEILLGREYKSTLTRILSHEQRTAKTVRSFFAEAYKAAEKVLGTKSERALITKDDRSNWISRFLDWFDRQDWGTAFGTRVGSDIEKTYASGARRTYAGVGADFTMPSIRATTYAARKLPKLVNTPVEFKAIVKTAITNTMSTEAWTIDEMAKTISSTWKDASKSRAVLVARTETTGAYNGGRVQGMKELGIKKKQWLHSRDGTVRDSHRIDQTIAVDEAFILGDGERVMFPGEGTAKNVCNCRCTVISVL